MTARNTRELFEGVLENGHDAIMCEYGSLFICPSYINSLSRTDWAEYGMANTFLHGYLPTEPDLI